MFHFRHSCRAFAACLLGVGIASGLLSPTAHAQFSICRSDPVLSLSNGSQIDVSASIGDDLSDVQKVVYVVHAPAGTKLLSLINTDSLMGLKESVQFYADQPSGHYATTTTVYTGQSNVSVTANSTVISVLGVVLGLKSANGYSAQPLTMQFSALL